MPSTEQFLRLAQETARYLKRKGRQTTRYIPTDPEQPIINGWELWRSGGFHNKTRHSTTSSEFEEWGEEFYILATDGDIYRYFEYNKKIDNDLTGDPSITKKCHVGHVDSTLLFTLKELNHGHNFSHLEKVLKSMCY